MRLVLPMEAVLCAVGLLSSPPGAAPLVLAAEVGALTLASAGLLVMPALSPNLSVAAGALAVAGVAGAAWCGHGGYLSFTAIVCLVPVGIFTGLFFPVRRALALHLAAWASLVSALSTSSGLARSLLVATLATVMVLLASLTIAVLAAATRREGNVDPATGLPNGFGLSDTMASSGYGSAFVVADIVLAGIGDVREALGYAVGTELMRRLVEDIGQVLPPGAVLGRVAGDELVVVHKLTCSPPGPDQATCSAPLQSTRGGDDVGALPASVTAEADQLAVALSQGVDHGRYLVESVEVAIRAHVGLALSPWHGTELAELVRRASASAAQGADTGNGCVLWHAGHRTLTAEDLRLLADLRRAADHGELWVAYQPQVDARSRLPLSVEALLRWRSPQHGTVPPGRFVPLAERSGLIDSLTDWALAEVLDAQVRWRQNGLQVPVSANLSAKSLHQPGLPEKIMRLLETRQLPAASLALEVTETAATPDLLEAINFLRPLHNWGVGISIDDFGTGYTSLSVLTGLPLDELKVDQSFVLRSPTSPGDAAIVRTVRELAHRLGLAAVAEGVETAELDTSMTELGFDTLQGYFYSKPLPEEDLIAFVRAEHLARAEGPIAGAARP
jgi:predicted signal transduction protein with EAL and GGDEF domain